MKKTLATLFLLTCLGSSSAYADNALILQTDFSLKDGAVSAMKGVAFGVDHNLKIFDLTHEIPPYNIWEGAYRLYQTASYWPQGSVFVSVVDPGVGTDRKSVVLKTKNGQYFVSPDNGTLTLVAESLGIESVRQIDEKTNRLKEVPKSHIPSMVAMYMPTPVRVWLPERSRSSRWGQSFLQKLSNFLIRKPKQQKVK
ncbi:acetolactate synthase [Escherichia coli]|nr:acetolactate synthase [Escherichia coli]